MDIAQENDILDIYKMKYEDYKYPKFHNRLFKHSDLEFYLKNDFSFDKSVIGYSYKGLPIYKLKIGKGKKKIFVWTQMHGNESTGTRAVLDVIQYLKLNSNILKKIQLDILPMLNPDGSNLFNRSNAMGVDINRDFNQNLSPEIKILKETVINGGYELLFNLHDQRSIFSVGKTNKSAIISFLSPSFDGNRNINENRKKAMEVIVIMNNKLQKLIPNHIGRYTDEFYPDATGDNFMRLGYPNVLIEAGYHPNDWDRNQTRKYIAIALAEALVYLADNEITGKNSLEEYLQIPINEEMFFDLIIRNVKFISKNGRESIADIALHYKDEYQEVEDKPIRKVFIQNVAQKIKEFGHLEIDGSQDSIGSEQILLKGEWANFTIKSMSFVNGNQI